jgi:hypothetical protein
MNNPKHMHLSDPGTGKTPTICTYQRYLWEAKQTPSIWTMPKSLLQKNRDEALLWGGWDEDEVRILDGPFYPYAPGEKAKVYLMGFKRFAIEREKFPAEFKAIQVDEFHKGYGGNNSFQTEALYRFCDKADYFTPMTGTLINGKMETAWPALQIIEPRYYGSFDGFKRHHTAYDPITGAKLGYRNHDRLQTILRRHCIRRLFKDIFGEQEIVTQLEWVDMAPEQRRLYDKFEDEAILELENFFITGKQPGVAFIRARQIMEHPHRFPNLGPDDADFVDIMPDEPVAKAERLDLHLTDHMENGTPFIIYAALVPQQHEILAQARALGLRVGYVGATGDRYAADSDFRAGKLDGIVCSPLVADAGFNWQDCGDQEVNHIIFASLPFVDVTYTQALRRVIRRKRKEPLRVTVMAYRNSVDARIMHLVQQKSADNLKVDPTQMAVKFF